MGTLYLVLIIGSLVTLTTCQVKDPRCNAPEVTPAGFLPHSDETECRKYYSCYGGWIMEFECPEGFFHLKCSPYDKCLVPNDSKLQEEGCKCKNCPPKGVIDAPKQDSEFCDEYVMCVEGVETKSTCPEGQSFDENLRKCKDKENVDCDMDLCSQTWDETTGKSAVGVVPSFRNCQIYFVCSKGVNVATKDCGVGFMYDINTEKDVNGVKFMGACVRKPATILSEGEELEDDLNPDLKPVFEEELGSEKGEIEVENPETPKTPECFNGRNWTPPILT